MRYIPKHTLRKVVTRLSWKARTGIVVAGCAGLAVAGAGIAQASVSSANVFTTSNGEAGYGTSAASGHTFKNIQAVVTPDQYGTTVQGGAIGIQLTTAPNTATPSTCYAAQLGLVANTGTSTYNVDYATGNLPSTTGVADCATGGIASATPSALNATALQNVPNSDSYWLSLTYVKRAGIVCFFAPRGHHNHFLWCRFFNRSGLWLQAEDLTTATTTTRPTVKWISDPHNFVHASAGISLDNSTALHACNSVAETNPAYNSVACQEVAEFDYVTVTNQGSNTPLLLDDSTRTPDMAVDGAPAMVDAHNSLQDTSPFTGSSITQLVIAAHGGIHGASAIGNAFQLFTADSIG